MNNLPIISNTEFSDEIEAWVIQEFKNIGLDTARSVLDKDVSELVKLTDLEEETILDVQKILREEFEDWSLKIQK